MMTHSLGTLPDQENTSEARPPQASGAGANSPSGLRLDKAPVSRQQQAEDPHEGPASIQHTAGGLLSSSRSSRAGAAYVNPDPSWKEAGKTQRNLSIPRKCSPIQWRLPNLTEKRNYFVWG